jgi:hypothetical protein
MARGTPNIPRCHAQCNAHFKVLRVTSFILVF